jgi:hypothetical protein
MILRSMRGACAILDMVVLVGEWFHPGGSRSAAGTAALHGRLALRITRGGR